MYKNMYNLKSKISLLHLSSITTMFAQIQGENKQKQEDKRSEDKRGQENGQTWFFSLSKLPFRGIY